MAMMTAQFKDSVCYRNFCAVIHSLPSQPYPFRPPPVRSVTDFQAHAQAREISAALDFRSKCTDEWKRLYSLTTLKNQAAGELAHCAWMASCANSDLPQSMPVATPAGEQAQQHRPIPGTTGEPPPAPPAP
eukprot:1261313-Pyramimonas_sp.AAC.1